MNNLFPKLGRASFAVGLLVILLLTYSLGSYGLIEDNEARFFEISWEMSCSDDWITPRLNFIKHFHKPPGTFWLVGASLKLFGASEWAGRLPVALAALLTTAIVSIWATQNDGREGGERTALVLVTSLQFWFLARIVLTDMFLTASVTSAFYWAWQARGHRNRRAWSYFWLSLAASMLFKGPVGVLVVTPVLLIYRRTDPLRRAWNLRPMCGIPVLLLISLPWYLIVCWQNDGLLSYFLGFQTVDRVFSTTHGRAGGWWFYFPVLVVGFFPWSAGLPMAISGAWKRRDEFDRFLLLWCLVPLVIFSMMGSKLPTYLLPVFPGLALLTSREASQPGRGKTLGWLALTQLGLLSLALVAYLTVSPDPILEPAAPHLYAVGLLIPSAILAAQNWRPRLSDQTWFVYPGFVFAMCLIILTSSLGLCDGAFSSRRLASFVRNQMSDEDDIVEVSDHLHGLPYYLRRRLIQVSYPRETQFESDDSTSDYLFPDLASYLSSKTTDSRTFYIIRSSDYDTIADLTWRSWDLGPWRLARKESSTAPAMP